MKLLFWERLPHRLLAACHPGPLAAQTNAVTVLQQFETLQREHGQGARLHNVVSLFLVKFRADMLNLASGRETSTEFQALRCRYRWIR
eukprot:9178170-Alexandrium_andersonii.AAC.1